MNAPYYFEIQVDDIERAKNFYEQIFGWAFTRAEGMQIEYWRIETEGIRGGMLKRPAPASMIPSGTNAFVNSMQVENFDAMSEKILGLGGRVALAKFAVPGTCWQGYFLDTESNTFGLFQVDEDAS